MSKVIEKILEQLQNGVEATTFLLEPFMTDRSHSYRMLRDRRRYEPKRFKHYWAEIYRKKKKFYNSLYYLKTQGLIKNTGKNKNLLWSITPKGLKRLKDLKQNPFSRSSINFAKPIGKEFTIISFDIPEKERKKRDWIRRSLVVMEFQYLQKSVWISKGKVDEQFIHALRDHAMLDYVHVFSINKSGTITEKV